MKRLKTYLIITLSGLLLPGLVRAQESMTIEDRYALDGINQVDIAGLHGMRVQIQTTSQKVLTVEWTVSGSQKSVDYYTQGAGLRFEERSNVARLDFITRTNTGENNYGREDESWLKALLKGKEQRKVENRESVSQEVQIYLPAHVELRVQGRYSDVDISGMNNKVRMDNRAGAIFLRNIYGDVSLDNEYGDITLEQVTGSMDLKSRSVQIEIRESKGNTRIVSDYSRILIHQLKGDLTIENRSGNVTVENLDGDYVHTGNYSTIDLTSISGSVDIDSRSATVRIEDAAEVVLAGDYTNMDLQRISSVKTIMISSKSASISFDEVAANVNIRGAYLKVSGENTQGSIRMTSKSGELDLRAHKGSIESEGEYMKYRLTDLMADSLVIDNRSGRVRAEFMNNPEWIQINSSSSDIDLEFKTGYNGEIAIAVEAGKIISDFKIPVISRSEADRVDVDLGIFKLQLGENAQIQQGEVGKAQGAKLIIANSSGDVRIRDRSVN